MRVQLPGTSANFSVSAEAVDHVLDLAALDAVGEVARTEQGGRRDDDGTELDAGEHDLPERHHVAEHEQHPVAAVDTFLLQPGRPAGTTATDSSA